MQSISILQPKIINTSFCVLVGKPLFQCFHWSIQIHIFWLLKVTILKGGTGNFNWDKVLKTHTQWIHIISSMAFTKPLSTSHKKTLSLKICYIKFHKLPPSQTPLIVNFPTRLTTTKICCVEKPYRAETIYTESVKNM